MDGLQQMEQYAKELTAPDPGTLDTGDMEKYAKELSGSSTIIPEAAPVTQRLGQQSQYDVFSGNVSPATEFATKPDTPVTLPEGNWQVEDAYTHAIPNTGHVGNRENQGWGNRVVVVNKDTGEKLSFNHLNKVDVQPGQDLTGGEIGATGHTGNSTGPHLAIEYWNAKGEKQDLLDSPYGQDIPK